jgi:hypothetical protein
MTTHNLRRSIVAIMLIKASIVLLAALFVFGPHQRPLVDGRALDRQILNDRSR